MGRFDENYIFRHATLEDCDEIMGFIRDEWPKKNHILATDRDFFLYEFQNNTLINFVIAVNRNTGLIDGILGYLRASNNDDFDIWTCMWLTRRKGSLPFLGIEIMTRLKSIVGYSNLVGVGTNTATAVPLVKNRAGHFTFKLKHFYKLSERTEFRIAKVVSPKKIDKPVGMRQAFLVPVENADEIQECIAYAAKDCIPRKDEWYINKRFFLHPVYDYLVWKIVESGQDKGILIGRELCVNDAVIMRVVDFLGKPAILDGLYGSFQQLMEEYHYEYIDFYITGIDDIHLNNAGFVLKTEDDKNIIPNYFEPFVQENIEIYGTSTVEHVRMCKADADQDRPNKGKENRAG